MATSPKVATYDLQPEMSAPEVSDTFVEAIGKGYDLIVVNYANPDMVGHTGDLSAAIRAVASTPPAGPENIARAGNSTPSRSESTPPLLRISRTRPGFTPDCSRSR